MSGDSLYHVIRWNVKNQAYWERIATSPLNPGECGFFQTRAVVEGCGVRGNRAISGADDF
jgi:hypothetical protein